MNVGLTGATGFIGSQLAELLVREGHRVTCLVRRSSNTRWIDTLPVAVHLGELLDAPSLEGFVRDKEILFHLAGTAKGRTDDDIIQANTTGTSNLCEAVIRFNPGIRRLVYVSSQEAVGLIPGVEPCTEDITPTPITAYGRSKAEAEEIIRSRPELPSTIIRPSPVFGPRDRDIFIMFKLISGGLMPMPDVPSRVSVVYSRNLVGGLIRCMESKTAEGNTYFLADDGFFTWDEIAEYIARGLEKSFRRMHIPRWILGFLGNASSVYSRITHRATILNKDKFRMMTHANLTVSNERAKRDFGYSTETPVETALIETSRWYRDNGWL